MKDTEFNPEVRKLYRNIIKDAVKNDEEPEQFNHDVSNSYVKNSIWGSGRKQIRKPRAKLQVENLNDKNYNNTSLNSSYVSPELLNNKSGITRVKTSQGPISSNDAKLINQYTNNSLSVGTKHLIEGMVKIPQTKAKIHNTKPLKEIKISGGNITDREYGLFKPVSNAIIHPQLDNVNTLNGGYSHQYHEKQRRVNRRIKNTLTKMGNAYIDTGKTVGKSIIKNGVPILASATGAVLGEAGATLLGQPELGPVIGAIGAKVGNDLGNKAVSGIKGGSKTSRIDIVKKVMKEQGLKLCDASKYVKTHNLY